MKTITLPKFRQTFEYDCGAKALQSVLVYYGIEIKEHQLIKDLKTTKEGTQIKNIIRVSKKYDLKTESKKMTIKDLKKYIKKKIPVIIVLQAWTKKKNVDWENNWHDGHYVVAIGYTRNKIIFEDPSAFERTYLKHDELEKRWHDIDENSKKYFHHGIAVSGKIPKFKSKKIIHMD